jgi:hypothetical protein
MGVRQITVSVAFKLPINRQLVNRCPLQLLLQCILFLHFRYLFLLPILLPGLPHPHLMFQEKYRIVFFGEFLPQTS